jgi:thiol-disulfide isomerase/thioredoxin
MKYQALFLGCMLSLLITANAQAQAVPESGQDNRVEWALQQSWPADIKVLDMVQSLDGNYVFFLSDRNEVQIFDNQGQIQGSIPVAPGVSAIDISPQGDILYLFDNDGKSFSSVSVAFVVDVDITGAPFKGPANAPVTLTLFTDFECPYCKKIVPLLELVLKNNPDTVKLAFKNMPLRFHKMADPSARAALAAGEQGKFWEFHDLLFGSDKLSDERIGEIAAELKLDMDKFKQDMDSGEIKSKIQKDLADAQKAGVTGTPTVFINGRKPQQRSPQGFQAIIDAELRKAGGK